MNKLQAKELIKHFTNFIFLKQLWIQARRLPKFTKCNSQSKNSSSCKWSTLSPSHRTRIVHHQFTIKSKILQHFVTAIYLCILLKKMGHELDADKRKLTSYRSFTSSSGLGEKALFTYTNWKIKKEPNLVSMFIDFQTWSWWL